MAAALTATGSLTLVSGALVLVGAVAAGQRRRTHEAVILKALCATSRQLRTAWLVEFGVLGLAAGLIAALVGTLASFGVVRYIMHIDWAFLPGRLAGDPDCVPRHDADLRLCWHCCGTAGQGGADAAERMTAGRILGGYRAFIAGLA